MPDPFSTLLQHLSSLPDHHCNRRTVLKLLGAAGLLPLLEGCSSRPLKIAAHPWLGYELLFLARQEGWLQGGNVQLIETASATDSLQALSNGTADAAALTLDEMLEARGSGIPLTAVLIFDSSSGADVVMARPGISSIQQLAGKRIGVEQSALGALVLQLTLQAAGLELSQVRVVPLTPNRHLDAWKTGQLDAVITYEPTALKLLANGAQIIYDSRSMPGMIFDLLATKPDLSITQASGLRAAVKAHFVAMEQLRHNPNDTAYRLADQLKLSPGQILEILRGLEIPSLEANQRYLGGAAPALLATARILNNLMLKKGLLKRPDNLMHLVSNAYLPSEGI